MKKLDVAAVAEELADNNFADSRLTKRLGKLVQSVGADPSASFPSQLTSAELEGAYRFFSNPVVTPKAILAPHFEATKRRLADESTVLVAHVSRIDKMLMRWPWGLSVVGRAVGRRGPSISFIALTSKAGAADVLRSCVWCLRVLEKEG